MAATLYHMDSANLFVGDADPTKSQFLTLKNVKLPMLEEATKDHTGGGAAATVTLGMKSLSALSLSFDLEGFNPDVIGEFMPAGSSRIKYTVLGNVRNIRTHEDVQAKMIIDGKMTKIDMSEFSKDGGMGTGYEINEVMGYQLFFGGVEKFYFDYFAGLAGVRVDGEQSFLGASRNLGLL